MSSARARQALKGRFAVNGDNNKARIVDVFEIVREGSPLTVALLRYDDEHDLVMRSISEMFGDFAIFWNEKDADRFIAGHRERTGAEQSPAETDDGLSTPGEDERPATLEAGVAKRRPRRDSH